MDFRDRSGNRVADGFGCYLAAPITKYVHGGQKRAYELVLRKNLHSDEDLDRILSPENLIRPNKIPRDRQSWRLLLRCKS